MLNQTELLYYWDSIMLILESLNYGSKIQATKKSVEEAFACADILFEDLPDDEYEIKTGFSCMLLASDTVSELPSGAINREIQEKIYDSFRNIQKSIESVFYKRYADENIDEILKIPKHRQVMENMIRDFMTERGFAEGG